MKRFELLAVFSLALLFCYSLLVVCKSPERTMVSSSADLNLKWIWRSTQRIRTPPLYMNNRVLVRTDSDMVAVARDAGTKLWGVPSGSVASILMEANPDAGILTFAADNNWALKAVTLETGSVLWSQRPSPPIGSIWAIALDRERVYTGLYRDAPPVRAFDLSSGNPIWVSDPILPQGYGANFLFVEEDGVYVFVASNLYVLNKENGKVERSIRDFLDGGSAVQLVSNKVYMWFKGTLRVKDVMTGRILWESNISPDYYSVIGKKVFVGSICCTLTALNTASGAIIWQRNLDARPISNPVAIGNTGYMILDNASIIAFDLETGQDRGTIQTSPPQVNPEGNSKGLATDGTNLYATFGDNTLFAFGK